MKQPSKSGKDLFRLIVSSPGDSESTPGADLPFDSQPLPHDCMGWIESRSGDRASDPEGHSVAGTAYRFFETPRRRYIVAEAPAEEQFARNLAAGASRAELALLVTDGSKGLQLQTKRHLQIAAVLAIPDIVLAVNNMDLAGFSREAFTAIAEEFQAFASTLGFAGTQAIPLTGLRRDNVSCRSTNMPWYEGPTLFDALDAAEIHRESGGAFRLPVLETVRTDPDFCGCAGIAVSGNVAVGDEVMICPSRALSRVRRIESSGGELQEVRAGQQAVIYLDGSADISPGDVLDADGASPDIADQFAAELIWMGEEPLYPGRSYTLRLAASTANASVTEIGNIVDAGTQAKLPTKLMRRNDIGHVKIAVDRLIAFDAYRQNRDMGGFTLVDRLSNRIVGAGTIVHALRRGQNIHVQKFDVNRTIRAQKKGQRPAIMWLTGLSGSGKSTIANNVEQGLTLAGRHCYILDGDNVRHGLNKDLGFTAADRVENIRRVSEVARLMADAGLIVLVSLISPFIRERAMAREIAGDIDFIEVFVDAPLAVCESRDPKSLYKKARAGLILNFTGIDAPYEAPPEPDLTLATADTSPEFLAGLLIAHLQERGIL